MTLDLTSDEPPNSANIISAYFCSKVSVSTVWFRDVVTNRDSVDEAKNEECRLY